jgi:hypothetical protein
MFVLGLLNQVVKSLRNARIKYPCHASFDLVIPDDSPYIRADGTKILVRSFQIGKILA